MSLFIWINKKLTKNVYFIINNIIIFFKTGITEFKVISRKLLINFIYNNKLIFYINLNLNMSLLTISAHCSLNNIVLFRIFK